jgi:hypothetical protein
MRDWALLHFAFIHFSDMLYSWLVSYRLSSSLVILAFWYINLFPVVTHVCGPGNVIPIATGYGLDGSGIESRWWGEIFRTSPDRPWGPPSLLYNGYRVFPRGKEGPGRDADLSPPSSAVVMKRVELYLYSPCGPYGLYRASVSVHGCTLKSHTCLQMQSCVSWPLVVNISSNMWVVADGGKGNGLALVVDWHSRGRTVVFTILEY